MALGLPARVLRRRSCATTASRRDALLPALREAGFRVRDPAGAYYVMTDIRDLTDEDDVTVRDAPDPRGRASRRVPGSSFYSRPELGRTKLRFAFPKRLETLEVAAARLVAGSQSEERAAG